MYKAAPSTAIALTCQDVVAGNKIFETKDKLKLLVACPSKCRDLKDRDVPVYGTDPFHEASSICRSAVYADIY